MIARSCALTSAGLRYTDERGNASNRHCGDVGSAGLLRSTIARRAARLSCRAFVPKNRFQPSAGRSAGTEDRPPLSRGQALRFIGGSLPRRAALENPHRTIQKLLLPVVDLVRVHPKMHRQLGDVAVTP